MYVVHIPLYLPIFFLSSCSNQYCIEPCTLLIVLCVCVLVYKWLVSRTNQSASLQLIYLADWAWRRHVDLDRFMDNIYLYNIYWWWRCYCPCLASAYTTSNISRLYQSPFGRQFVCVTMMKVIERTWT